eukprot:8740850-Pyramimonas_sp.AAC.1
MTILKYMLWEMKSQSAREKEARDGLQRSTNKLEALKKQQASIETDILLEQETILHWKDLEHEAKEGGDRSPPGDEDIGHDRRRALAVS